MRAETKGRLLSILVLCAFALVLLASTTANAQVTIFHVKVVITSDIQAVYCDAITNCAATGGLNVWNIPAGGQPLNPGQTMVLTQTGLIATPNGTGSNFDTSERIAPSGFNDCGPGGAPCTTAIYIDTGSGFPALPNYTDGGAGNELTAFNQDTGADAFQEARQWSSPVVVASNYTLSLGYADNVHGPPGCVFNCTPTLFAPSADNFFYGQGLGAPTGQCTTAPCWDGGAILITGQGSPAPCVIPSSQTIISGTSWNKFNTQGSGNVVWIHAHIGKPSGVPTSTITTVDFTGVTFVLNGTTYNLPDGHIIFDPAAGPASTSSGATGWTTIINPNSLSDEIFFVGDAVPVDANIKGGGKADFSFTTSSSSTALAFKWQWSAAVYTQWLGDNAANIAPIHATLHAGAPRNPTQQSYLIQGPRGGGGSNFTGSWSATGNGSCP